MLSGMSVTRAEQAPAAITLDMSSLATSYTDAGGATTTYSVRVQFDTDGTIDVFRVSAGGVGADLTDEQTTYSTNVAATYVRCQYNSGSHMTSGDAEDTWHLISVSRFFQMTYTSSGGPDSIAGNFTFQLGTDGATADETKTIDITVGELV